MYTTYTEGQKALYSNKLTIGVLDFLIISTQGEESVKCVSYNFFALKFLPLSTLPATEIWNYLTAPAYPAEIYFHFTNTWGLVDKVNQTSSHFTVLVTDITAIKQRELAALKQIDTLQVLNKDLENFAFIAAHDLKEPARKVVAFGERFLAKTKDVPYTDDQRLFLSKMIDGASRMYQLVDYVLDFSRQTKKLEYFKDVDLNILIQEVIQELQLAIKSEEAIIHITSLPSVKGDEMQLIGVFKNILSNALKFQIKPISPIIHIDAYQPTIEDINRERLNAEYSYAGVVISDNGIGFEEGDKERIFNLFGRLRGRSEYTGVGLGLAICKRLIKNHGGAIWAEGQPYKGARFTIILPKV